MSDTEGKPGNLMTDAFAEAFRKMSQDRKDVADQHHAWLYSRSFKCRLCGADKYTVVFKEVSLELRPMGPASRRRRRIDHYVCQGCTVQFVNLDKFSTIPAPPEPPHDYFDI